MEPNFQTSFIPKKPIIPERSAPSRPVGLLVVVSIFILLTVLLSSLALYFYKGVLAKNISQMENDLNLAKNRFEPSKITELQVLDKRLRASSEVLSQHTAITPIFQLLELLTMKTIRYTKFSYNIGSDNDPKNAGMVVKMAGQAIGYRSIALQADLLSANKNLINPIFSNLTLDGSGNVLFDLEFSVDPSLVNYKQMLLTQS